MGVESIGACSSSGGSCTAAASSPPGTTEATGGMANAGLPVFDQAAKVAYSNTPHPSIFPV